MAWFENGFILIDCYSESSGGRSSGRSTPHKHDLRFILIDCYSESSDRSSGRSTSLLENGNLRFILIDCYSESSGRPGGRSMVICSSSSLLLWELPQIKWQIYFPIKWFEIHTDRLLLWELRQIKWQINGNLRFILIDTTLRAQVDQMAIWQWFILIDCYSESSGRSSGRSTIPINSDLRFILIDCYSESSDRSSGRSTL